MLLFVLKDSYYHTHDISKGEWSTKWLGRERVIEVAGNTTPTPPAFHFSTPMGCAPLLGMPLSPPTSLFLSHLLSYF